MTILRKYWPSIWSCLVLELHLNAFFSSCQFTSFLFITVQKSGDEPLPYTSPPWLVFPVHIKMQVSISMGQPCVTKINIFSFNMVSGYLDHLCFWRILDLDWFYCVKLVKCLFGRADRAALLQFLDLEVKILLAVSLKVGWKRHWIKKEVILASHRTAEVGSDFWRPSNATFPSDSRPSCSRLPKAVFNWLLNISKHGQSTTSLGDVF